MANKKAIACKRPYLLGKRLELSDHKKMTILVAARKQLASSGFFRLTMDGLAGESGVTRQTVHNLFGTKAGVLEALFDQLAMEGGMERMRNVMQQTDGTSMLDAFVEVFTDFWAKDRLLMRRIHGIAAIDPEFGAVVEARNRRRQMAAGRVVDRLSAKNSSHDPEDRTRKITTLYALTSFEFFDVLVESGGNERDAAQQVLALVRQSLMPIPLSSPKNI